MTEQLGLFQWSPLPLHFESVPLVALCGSPWESAPVSMPWATNNPQRVSCRACRRVLRSEATP